MHLPYNFTFPPRSRIGTLKTIDSHKYVVFSEIVASKSEKMEPHERAILVAIHYMVKKSYAGFQTLLELLQSPCTQNYTG